MRRHSGKHLTPRPSPFAAWTAFVRRTVERPGRPKVAVLPTDDAPPKPRPRRKSKPATKRTRRARR